MHGIRDFRSYRRLFENEIRVASTLLTICRRSHSTDPSAQTTVRLYRPSAGAPRADRWRPPGIFPYLSFSVADVLYACLLYSLTDSGIVKVTLVCFTWIEATLCEQGDHGTTLRPYEIRRYFVQLATLFTRQRMNV